MNKTEIFEILGIESTNDKEAIRQAYRNQLVLHHPEDDPEGFKALRTAYEEALVLVDEEESEDTESKELSVGELWIQEAQRRYASLSGRRDAEGWKKWLSEDYCIALDTSEEARDRFMQFSLSHFYYPDAVWRMFDREFQIVADRKQLAERYPENFLDYIQWTVESGAFIDFDMFEGQDDADIDGYIRQYYDLKYAVEAPNVERAEELLAALDASPVRHVFEDVERMKLASVKEDWQTAENYLCLFEAREDSNIYIRLMMAGVCERMDRWEQAMAIYEALLAEDKDIYAAGMGKARCQMHDRKYQEAKENLLNLLEVSKNDEQAQRMMVEINGYLIEEFLSREEALTDKEKLDLGWCYLQNEQYDQTIAIIEKMDPDPSVQADYHNLAGRVYLYTQQEEKALPHLKHWLHELELIDANDPEKGERKRRLPYAHFCISLCYQKLSQEDMGCRAEVLTYMDTAIETEKDAVMRLSYLSSKAEWMNRINCYKEAMDICDQILAEDKRCLPAYVSRQEAAYHLQQGQRVVDDFYRIVEMYPGYAKCYLLAAKTFYFYQSYQNAIDIIDQAESAGVMTDSLKYIKAKCGYYLGNTMEQVQAVADTYEELLSSQELPADEQEQLRVDLAECLIRVRDYKTALVRVDRFMGEYPDNHTLMWIRGDVLCYLDRYEEALADYRTAAAFFPGNPGILCDMARCLSRLRRYGEAVETLKKVIAIDADYRDVNGQLMEAYHQLMLQEKDADILQLALPYGDRQIELTPSEYDYIQRGILYQDAGEPEKAMDDFLKALELNPKSAYASNNLGFDYRLMDRFEEAIPMLEKSLVLRKEQGLALHIVYQNLAVTLLIMGAYQRAEAVLLEGIEYKKDYNARLLLGEVYQRAGQAEKALKVYEEMMRDYPEDEDALLVESGFAWGVMGDGGKGVRLVKAQYKKNPEHVWYFLKYAEFLSETRRDYRKVLQLFRHEPKTDDLKQKINWQHFHIEALWRTGRKKQAEEVLASTLKMLEEYGEKRYYGIDNQLMYRFDIAMCLLFGGRPEAAEKIFEQMLKSRRCRSCHFCKCFEALYGLGYVRLMEGRTDEAFEYFKQALAVNPTDAICQYYGKEKRTQI